MSVNLVGLDPRGEIGRVLRLSNFIWYPMWEYVEEKYPDIAKNINNARTSNSSEMHYDWATSLCYKLYNDLETGAAREWLNRLEEFLDSLPDEPCFVCLGFGHNRRGILQETDEICYRCDGAGMGRPYVSQYHFNEHDLWFFASFLQSCGGFKIT